VSVNWKAVPKWLTQEHVEAIRLMYQEAKRLTRETGIPMVVDHIVPLRGKNVCGLHIPSNLQIITKQANAQKGNKEVDY
jgi:5-methylcytosine-specific restriction endonuclease McrA